MPSPVPVPRGYRAPDYLTVQIAYALRDMEEEMINGPVIGTCGNCGGPVSVPAIWHGVSRPTPRCERCHAAPQQSFGPILPMRSTPHD